MHDQALSVQVGRLGLRNPVLTASGTYGSGLETALEVPLERLGGVITKSVTTRPRRGNLPPRILETAGGVLNSIGLMNPGLEVFLKEVLPLFLELPCAHIVNLAGESVADFEALAGAFDGIEGVDALELNVSCPNVARGLDFGTQPALLEPLVAACRARTEKPLWVKLSPNITAIEEAALAAQRGGAEALSLVNTYRGLALDWRCRRPLLGSPSGCGGLSGPAIKPLALAALWRVRCAVSLPLVGIGGISSPEDVLEFMVAGASAVQIGTANFKDPMAPVKIADALMGKARGAGVDRLTELVGTLRVREDT